MKILNIIYLATCIILFLGACKKSEPTSFSAAPQIYFYDAETNTGKVRDSVMISFARLGNDIKETTVSVPLEFIGTVSTSDRPFRVVVNKEKTTAVEGKHFALLPEKYKVMKGANKAVLPIKIISTSDLDNKTVQVVLKLEKNESFDTNFQFINSDLHTMDLSSYRILISNMLLKPSWWDGWIETYLGTFSRKKVELIFDVTKMNLDAIEKAATTYDWDLLKAISRETQIQINYMRSIGQELKDENNRPINMGSNVN
ncbi:DUF4843 domain-containing protein [Sphingobacterium sp. BIGb0165]|uniref:DUF4843 domain-containing protein n=1 Tax=Sphingobacterium sp. BIGb0165 TaxID=2940615 RepID=UPI00216A93BD|nr:DUF4843 domain-containing protein [Sphingobacterium sp. BIGb0165]MCS4224655.1 hypothetical protein [Sphingobacterium sp. BIGb0165]